MDLNVLPPYRDRGIGTQLLEVAEQLAGTRNHVVGLAIGLYDDYGSALDGKGVTHNYQSVIPGDSMPVDDDLVLWFTKQLVCKNE